jgi:hypothetical protein
MNRLNFLLRACADPITTRPNWQISIVFRKRQASRSQAICGEAALSNGQK